MGIVEDTCSIPRPKPVTTPPPPSALPSTSQPTPQINTQTCPKESHTYDDSNLTVGEKTWAIVNNTIYHVHIDEVILDKANLGIHCCMLNFSGQPEGTPGFVGRDNIFSTLDEATAALATATNKRAMTGP